MLLFDAGNPKAHCRRAQAHLGLGNLALAHDDALRLLGLAPACSEVLQLRTRVALVEQRCAAEAAAAGAGRQVPQSLGEDTAAVGVLAVAEDVLAGAEDVKPGVGRAQLGVAPKKKAKKNRKKERAQHQGTGPVRAPGPQQAREGPSKDPGGQSSWDRPCLGLLLAPGPPRGEASCEAGQCAGCTCAGVDLDAGGIAEAAGLGLQLIVGEQAVHTPGKDEELQHLQHVLARPDAQGEVVQLAEVQFVASCKPAQCRAVPTWSSRTSSSTRPARAAFCGMRCRPKSCWPPLSTKWRAWRSRASS